MKKVHPSQHKEGLHGIGNPAFEGPTDETQETSKVVLGFHLDDVVKSQLQANNAGKDWREYVTRRRLQFHMRTDSRFTSRKQTDSVAERDLGLEVDDDVRQEDMQLWRQATKGVSPRQNSLRDVRKLNRKLIEHFVMLNTQSPEIAEVDLELIHNLVQRGADINCADRYGQTVLHEAARLWHTDVAMFLIENGADVTKSDRYGRSPLHVAAATNYPEMIEFLLDRGASVTAKTSKENQTPLHFAARNDAVDACKVLVKCGADIEAKDYRNRTPVYVAAELDRSETARWLMENGADVGICDDTGQSCMTHMITKMGPVARDALDKFHKTDRPNRKQYFYLNLLEHDVSDEKEADIEGTHAKTPLQVIVGYKQLDIIMHPVILKMLEVKWLNFGRIGAIKLLLINLLYILIWTILAVGVPWQTRYQYVLPGADVWRIIFWILAMGSTSYFITIEIMEITTSRKRFARWKDWRETNIKRDTAFCHNKWPEEKNYLEREVKSLDDMVPAYFHDFWNFFDWTVYFLNFCVCITHVVNVGAYTSSNRNPACCTPEGCSVTAQLIQNGTYTERSACAVTGASVNNGCLSVWVNRIFAINIIMMWLRLMKNIRAFRTLGPFVVMLGKITYDVLRFLFLYFEFYIPYACAFWMIFGDEPSIETMSSVDQMLFSLYRITLVDDYQYDQMHAFDVVMTYVLVGTFLGISAILCINLFIALLSDTFQRVYDNANANAVMQQAILILGIEENLSKHTRKRFIQLIKRKCSPREEYYDDDLTTTEGDDLKKATIQVRDQMEEVLEHIKSEKQEKENLERHMRGDFLDNERHSLMRHMSSTIPEDDIDGRFGKAALFGKGLAIPGVYTKITTDMSNIVSTMNKYQKGNENIMRRMQRDLKEIKQLLMQTVPGSSGRLSRKQQSLPLDSSRLPPISDSHQRSDDVYQYSPIDRLMRESSAGRHDQKSKVVHSSQEQQEPLSQRSSEVELVVLPGASTSSITALQSDNFPGQSGLPSMEFSTVDIPDSEVGSSHV